MAWAPAPCQPPSVFSPRAGACRPAVLTGWGRGAVRLAAGGEPPPQGAQPLLGPGGKARVRKDVCAAVRTVPSPWRTGRPGPVPLNAHARGEVSHEGSGGGRRPPAGRGAGRAAPLLGLPPRGGGRRPVRPEGAP